MLYFIQEDFLHKYDEPCFEDSIKIDGCYIEIKEVNKKYGWYGSGNIYLDKSENEIQLNDAEKILINDIVDYFSKYTMTGLYELMKIKEDAKI